MVEKPLNILLRLEGAALLVASVVVYRWLDTSWWMFGVLFFAPDISFLGYVLGPRAGAILYNMLHSTIGPLALGVIAWWLGPQIISSILASAAAIWLAHIGFDRALGYGLKYSTGFKYTHLGKL